MKHDYSLFKRKNSDSWYFYYYDGDERKSRSTGKKRKYEAEEVAEAFIEQKGKTRVRLQEYAAPFFTWDECPYIKLQHARKKQFSKAVAQSRRGHLVNYILPRFGGKYVDELSRGEIEKWLIGLELSNQTKNHILFSFRIVLRMAEHDNLIPFSPLDKVEPLGDEAEERKRFSKEEIVKLFPHDIPQLVSIWGDLATSSCFFILASTGIRSGEVRALRWKHLYWNKGLFIENAIKPDNSEGTTKNGEVRVVILSSFGFDLLRAWHDASPFKEPEDYIFFGEARDIPLNRKTLTHRLYRTLKKAEIPQAGRVVHSFRHTFNTLMRGNIPSKTLQAITGHKSDRMTERYDHPSVEEMFERIENSFFYIL